MLYRWNSVEDENIRGWRLHQGSGCAVICAGGALVYAILFTATIQKVMSEEEHKIYIGSKRMTVLAYAARNRLAMVDTLCRYLGPQQKMTIGYTKR